MLVNNFSPENSTSSSSSFIINRGPKDITENRYFYNYYHHYYYHHYYYHHYYYYHYYYHHYYYYEDLLVYKIFQCYFKVTITTIHYYYSLSSSSSSLLLLLLLGMLSTDLTVQVSSLRGFRRLLSAQGISIIIIIIIIIIVIIIITI